MKTSVLVLVFITITKTRAEVTKYNNYTVFRLTPTTIEHLNQLKQLQNSGYDFWKGPTALFNNVDIMVPPEYYVDYYDFVNRINIESEIYIKDVQKLVDKSIPKLRTTGKFNWASYHRGFEINSWLEELLNQYPNIVTLQVIGKSYEGRDIKGVKVSYKTGNKAIFLEGGIHAREWISPATVTYILNQLLTSQDPAVRDIAESYDWYFFPVTNPDGYEYSFIWYRLWRKSRKPYPACTGADLNRNWSFHWMEGGASNNPCDEDYAGPNPFSEPETKAISDFVTSIKDDLVAYIAFHAYGQQILIPYGHNGFAHRPVNFDELLDIGMKAKDSLSKRYGTVYRVGNIVDILYAASGSSIDWARGEADIPICLLFELRDKYGFLLPPEEIIPTAKETLDSLVTIVEEMKSLGY